MTQPFAVKLTRVQADPYEGPLPHAYVVLKQSQLCRCGHLHQWSTMMTETVTRSNLGSLTTFHRRVDEPKYNLPIKRVIEQATAKVMFCHECYATATLDHLPSMPKPQDPTAAQALRASPLTQQQPPRTRHWTKDGTERYEETAKSAKPKKPQTTLDDLIGDM